MGGTGIQPEVDPQTGSERWKGSRFGDAREVVSEVGGSEMRCRTNPREAGVEVEDSKMGYRDAGKRDGVLKWGSGK